MKKRNKVLLKRAGSIAMVFALSMSSVGGFIPQNIKVTQAAENRVGGGTKIENDSLSVQIGDLGQIAVMNIKNNRKNNFNEDVNFVLPNDTSPQNDVQHQWMGEMIFSYRTSQDGNFPTNNSGFVEVDTNKTLAEGGSTTASNINENNPYIEKKVVDDKKIEVTYKGLEENSNVERAMKGFNVSSVYDMETDDGSLLWNITLENTSNNYIEFGDVGLPMPWNNKYMNIENTYNNCVTAHTFAGADSGYAYAIRCSGEGNYMLFTPVVESGARIEYVDNWLGVNGLDSSTIDHRADETFANWTIDSGGWPAGLSVYYIHSKDIQKTGRGYYTDATSLVLQPGEKKTYQFKFSAIRAGDNTPQNSADDHNNSSDLMQERENNLHSILYKSGMIDAIAVPGFQTAINMDTQLDLHYDEEKIKDVSIDIQCVHENDPYDKKHIPLQKDGLVNNSRTGRGEHGGNEGYSESCELKETKVVDGESHHIYNLKFGCIGNNSVRVNYKLNVDGTYVDKFTEFEFNVLTEIKDLVDAHSEFMVNETQDTDPDSETFGIYSDWYLASGKDTTQNGHWGDDWSHDNINFITVKNYLDPNPDEIKSIENYLIDFMWENYMKNNHENYVVANYLHQSGVYTDTLTPYSRTFSEVMEATGFYNMYRIEKAYPDLIEYREQPEYYLEKAYNIYINRVGSGAIGFYGEQQIPDMIESLKKEGMTEEAKTLQEMFAKNKGTNVLNAKYPYGSEFEYDNTGEEGAYAAAKALLKYYPSEADANKVQHSLDMTEWKTRAMRGIQPTWYQYADPVFRAGESWWNFQYTASLAGSIMDDNLKYQNNDSDYDRAWAARVNYAAKLSNFNAVNMGQISDKYVGSVSWRYNMYKSGNGTINVNDGGTRVMNNGWNDFSGESEEGLYGSLLRISSDVVGDDPIFGLVGYGCQASNSGSNYTVTPQDGVGKRINLIDEKVYVELVQDKCTSAVISKDGTSFELKVEPSVSQEHISQINLSGAGIASGYYSISVDGEKTGQVYVDNNHEGNAYTPVSGSASNIVITKIADGKNTAPTVEITNWKNNNSKINLSTEGNVTEVKAGEGLQLQAEVSTSTTQDVELQAMVPFKLRGIVYDDGMAGTLTYKWEVISTPENGELTFISDTKPFTDAKATVNGEYIVKLTVNDGELETEKEFTIQIGQEPDRIAPEITSIEGKQDAINTTIANLTGEAKADPIYEGALSYKWTVQEQPQGGNAVIADANKQNAVLKVDKAGDYTVRLTVTDADTISFKDITITMNDKADGIWRSNPVITQVNTAPELPTSMKAVDSNGEYQEGTVTWNEITSDKYAQTGEFEVTGTVAGIKVGVKVCVVSGKSQNVALFATPSGIIDDVGDLGGVKGLNDGYDPTSSRDTSHGVWHNWRGGAQGDPAWVMYTWEEPTAIYATDAYYYSDGNFKPKTVLYEYLDSENNWREVPNAEGLGVELNQYNHTDFAPVVTKGLRMTMTPETLGCGVIEWKVSGYSEQIFIDKKALESQISRAKGLDMSLFEDSAQATLNAAVTKAQGVLDKADATQEEIDAAVEELGKVMAKLPSKDNNLAYVAEVSTSFVSSWEKLESVNDGKLDGAHYGSWGNESAEESITYTWGTKVKIQGMDIYFWSDGGGIQYPASYVCEYLNDSGNWVEITNVSESESNKADSTWHVKVSFDETQTTAVRLTMKKQETDGNGVGLWEWKVYSNTDGNEIEDKLENLALDSNITVDGVCNYDGQDGRRDDPVGNGGLPKLHDGFDPSASNDLNSHGGWLNYSDRVDSEGNAKVPWVSYTWNQPVILHSTDIYYFSEGEGSGHEMPKAVQIEILKEDDSWEVLNVTPGCTRDQYNKTDLGKVSAKGIKLTLTPETWDNNDSELVHGVGILEWKVWGTYASGQVSGQSITKASALRRGKSKAVNRKAAIDTTDNQKVNWQVTGNTAEGTSIDTNGYLTVDEQEKAASITVKAILKEDSTCTSEIALKVVPKEAPAQKKTLKVKNIVVEDKIYDATKNATVKEITFEGAAENETISYTAEALFESAKAAENAKVTVVVTLTGSSSENYILENNTIETTATIKKANPEYTLPENLTAKEGQTLKDVTLPKGFAFKDDLTTSVGTEGKHEFDVIYTPEDTENYNTVTGLKVIITVTKDSGNNNESGGGTISGGGSSVDVSGGSGSGSSGGSGSGSSGGSGSGGSGNGSAINGGGSSNDNSGNNNDSNDNTPTQPDKEPGENNNTQTVIETKPDGTVIKTVTEIAQNGDIIETKTVTITDNDSVLTVVKETADGKTEANAVINAGSQGKVVISTKYLEILAEDKDVDKYTVEIVSATVNAAPKKTKSTVVEVSIPVVNGVSMEKIVCTKDGIEAAKKTGKDFKIIVTVISENGGSESSTAGIENGGYVATIPAKQLAKIDSSVESVNFAITVTGQKKLSTNSIDKTVKTKLVKSGSNAKKTCVISTIENNAIKDVGMKFKIDVINSANNVNLKEGNTVYLYKYNNSTKKFEEMAYTKQVIGKDGTINISGYSGMKYIVSSKKLSGNSVTTIKQGINLKANKNTIKKGKKLPLTLVLPDTVSTKKKFGTEKASVVYKSKKPGIATVSKNGVIKAKGKGKVTVTAVINLSSGRKITKKKQVTVK